MQLNYSLLGHFHKYNFDNSIHLSYTGKIYTELLELYSALSIMYIPIWICCPTSSPVDQVCLLSILYIPLFHRVWFYIHSRGTFCKLGLCRRYRSTPRQGACQHRGTAYIEVVPFKIHILLLQYYLIYYKIPYCLPGPLYSMDILSLVQSHYYIVDM